MFQGSVLASVRGTRKGTRVLECLAAHPVGVSVDFVEVSWGPAAVDGTARGSDIAAAPAIVHREVSYGVLWDLSIPENIGAVDQLLQHLGSSCECFHLAGQAFPAELARLAVARVHLTEKQGRAFAIALSGECFPRLGRISVEGIWYSSGASSLGLLSGLTPASMMKAPVPSLVRDPITG